MYSISQFAKLIGKSVKTLQRWDREGVFSARRTCTGRRYYTEEDLLKYTGKLNQNKYNNINNQNLIDEILNGIQISFEKLLILKNEITKENKN